MLAIISQDQWTAVRAAVRQAADRFAALIATGDPHAMATRDWTVADTAAHVAEIAHKYTELLKPQNTSTTTTTHTADIAHKNTDLPHPQDTSATAGAHVAEIAGRYTGLLEAGDASVIASHVVNVTVDTVAEFNAGALRRFGERDPRVLGERLRANVDTILARSDGVDPAMPVPWLGGSLPPLAGVLAHLMNELLVHGRDIARALGVRWVIAPEDAALFFELFVVGVIRGGVGRLLDNDEPARERRIAVEFRSRHTTPVTLVLHRGRVSVAEPGGAIDVRLTFDPATLILMMFHRIGRARAVLSGKVAIHGRRPWLLPAFLRTVRLP